MKCMKNKSKLSRFRSFLVLTATQGKCIFPHEVSQVPESIENLFGLILGFFAEPVTWESWNVISKCFSCSFDGFIPVADTWRVVLQTFDVFDVGFRVENSLRSWWNCHEEWLNRSWHVIHNILMMLNGLLMSEVHLWTASGDWSRDDLLWVLMVMVNDLLLWLLLWCMHRAIRIVLMQMLTLTCNVVLSTILRLDDLSWSLYNVNLTNVLHQTLNVWQWWLVSLSSNAVAPQAVIDDRLRTAWELSEISLNATNTFSNSMLQSVAGVFKLKVALVPSAFENLLRREFFFLEI